MSTLLIEKYTPYALGAIAVALWLYAGVKFPEANDVLGSTLTISAILTGFVATSKALLMTLNNETMKSLKTSGYISDLLSYLGQSIYLSFIVCIISIVGYFVDTHGLAFGAIWIFFTITAGSAFIRVTLITLKILSM
tara:strand:+ start:11470 stop:11880 length:411 start_codon:yes stop_codon:yes gene_type:complete